MDDQRRMAATENGQHGFGGLRGSFRAVRGSFRRWRRTMEQRDPKRIGVLGAPQCRCTPLVLALCVALTGLVVLGAGSCVAAFMWSDTTPRTLGFCLVALGVTMLVSGVGLFIYDTKVRSLMPPGDPSVNTYAYNQQPVVRVPSEELSLTAARNQALGVSPMTNVYVTRSSVGGPEKPHSQGVAPPPYEEEDQRKYHRGSSKQQKSAGKKQRDAHTTSSIV